MNMVYTYIIYAILALSFLVQTYYYLRYYTAISIRSRRLRQGKIAFQESRPPVSVIICSRDEGENIEQFLPLVLEQNYPEYEVIVVDDSSMDNSVEILEQFKLKYHNLYFTSLPPSTRVISHKKLAITVGVKAAKNEILLFSDADCRPLTPNWISDMVRDFSESTEFVIGYGGFYRDDTPLSALVSYDAVFDATRYMGFAYAGKPYMAVGRNLAYRKSTFLRNRGFAGNLHITSGEDDLLVNALGSESNTVIEPSLSAKTLSLPKTSWKEWFLQKRKYLGSMALYTSKSKLRLFIEPVFRMLFYAAFILALVFSPPLSHIFWTVISLFVARFIIQYAVINSTANALGEKKFHLSIIICDILIPIITVILMVIGKFFRKTRKLYW